MGKRAYRARKPASADEHETLRTTAESLRRSNDQLTALYNVFCEINETLSLRSVVSTTLRETQKIMNADAALIRKLEGGQLVVVGALSGEIGINGVAPVPLGEGLTGLAAQEGRTIRVDEGAETIMRDQARQGHDSMAPDQTGRPPLESGIIAPLIVGSRMVGTLSCWSRRKKAFGAQDERILEMMASQVATAIVAADAIASSELRARLDVLTDLPNRRQLSEDLKVQFGERLHAEEAAVIVMADIDHFKKYNDDFGHHAGDIALQTVATVMRAAIREADRVYRYGGEEFLFIFPDTNAAEGMQLAERIREAIDEMRLPEGQQKPHRKITISMGLANRPEHGYDMDALIKQADAAMYEAKAAGRNNIVVWQNRRASVA